MAGDGKESFRENKTWKTAYNLQKNAEKKGKKMPFFFSAADEQSGLIYVAQISLITIIKFSLKIHNIYF